MLGFIAFEEAMLRRFKGLVKADLARRGDPHTLQPGVDREPTVQGELDEGAHLAGAGVVPNFGQHLGVRGIVEV